MITNALGATRDNEECQGLAVHYRVRRLTISGDASERCFASEAAAREHHRSLVEEEPSGALILVERLERIAGDGVRPQRYEVTTVTRDSY